MPRAATRTPRASQRTGSTAPASTAWSNVLRALYWAPASMPQHRAGEHAAHPDAASTRLQSGSLTAAQRSTSTCGCAAQRSSSGASPHCRSFAQCSVRAAQRRADPWHAQADVRRRPAPSECELHRRPCLPQPRASSSKRQHRACFSETFSIDSASVLFFLPFLYALHIASIPFRVSTSLKPAQQLNRSLSRRSIISLTHFARCPLSPLPPA